MAAPNQFGFKGQKQFKQPGHTIEMCQVPHKKKTSLPAKYLEKKKEKRRRLSHGCSNPSHKKDKKVESIADKFQSHIMIYTTVPLPLHWTL